MKTFVQEGALITVPAPADTLSDDGVEIGKLFGVAQNDALTGEDLTIATEGVHAIAKEATATTFAVGDQVEWDAGNSRVIALAAGDRVGVVVKAAAATDATVDVKLLASNLP